MIVRRTLEGAEKCALRDFLLEEDRAGGGRGSVWEGIADSIAAAHTGVDLGHLVGIWAIVCRRIKSRWSSQRASKSESALGRKFSLAVGCGELSGDRVAVAWRFHVRCFPTLVPVDGTRLRVALAPMDVACAMSS
jgi:hypothetical protein